MTHKRIMGIARITDVLYFRDDRLKSCGVMEHYGSKSGVGLKSFLINIRQSRSLLAEIKLEYFKRCTVAQ